MIIKGKFIELSLGDTSINFVRTGDEIEVSVDDKECFEIKSVELEAVINALHELLGV